MKIFLSVFVFTLLLTSGICQATEPPTTITDSTTTVLPTSVGTTTPTTKIDTTTTPTTKIDTTTTPTTKIDTTTVQTSTKIDTTTVQTTTSSTPVPTTTPLTSTSTVKSTTAVTTTTRPITTTPEPPKPDLGEWNVTEGNITCIRADLKVRFKIPVEDKFEYIALSPNATNDESSCNSTNGTQVLLLRDSDYTFSMTFDKDGNTKTYVKEISFSYRLPPNIIGEVTNEIPRFSVQSGSSYLCNTGNVALQNVTMEIIHIQLQAFGNEANLAFGATEECEADFVVNDKIPIVVGCALLALVVIVLVAYFVGRRRSRQKGYQSV